MSQIPFESEYQVAESKTHGRPSPRMSVLALSLAAAFWSVRPMLSGAQPIPWLLLVSAALLAAALVRPEILTPALRPLLFLAEGFARLMTAFFLALAFYWLLTPFALVMRLFGKKFLSTGKDPALTTYWLDREGGPCTAESMRRQF